jgi:hypothetical protein
LDSALWRSNCLELKSFFAFLDYFLGGGGVALVGCVFFRF